MNNDASEKRTELFIPLKIESVEGFTNLTTPGLNLMKGNIIHGPEILKLKGSSTFQTLNVILTIALNENALSFPLVTLMLIVDCPPAIAADLISPCSF